MVYFSFVSFLCVKPFLGKSMSSVESEHSSTHAHAHTHTHTHTFTLRASLAHVAWSWNPWTLAVEFRGLSALVWTKLLCTLTCTLQSVCTYWARAVRTHTHAHPSTLSLWAPGNLRILCSRNSCTKRECTQCAYRSNRTNGASFTDHLHVIDLFVVLTS